MTTRALFREAHRQLLDYSDLKVTEATSKWGIDAYSQIKEVGLEITTADAEKQTPFIYAVATAVIVGEFAKLGYGDYFSDETEMDLSALDLSFIDIEGFVDKEMPPERRGELMGQYYLNLQDIWGSIQDYKNHIYASLTTIYASKGLEPKVYIFKSLNKILGEDAFLEKLDPKTHNAYQYIDNGFKY